MKIEIYSDVSCPWCYIGKRRFERALEEFPGRGEAEIVLRSFQLDPAAPDRPMPMREYLKRKFGARAGPITRQVSEIAQGEGIAMDFDRGVIVNTFTAHRLLRLAEREHGAAVQRALGEKLFEAHFERGQDVADPEVLAALARDAGLEPERVRAYLAGEEGVEETRRELAEAAERGIRAVPTFVFDSRFAVEGAQSTEAFRGVLAEVAAGSGPDTTGG